MTWEIGERAPEMSSDEAFIAFVRANSRSLFRTAFLLTGAKAAAEDLLQETLTKLYPQWGRVERADSPMAYVRRSLNNSFVSSLRHQRAKGVTLWELPDGWLDAGGVDLADAVVDRELVWRLIGSLPARQRAAVVMRHFHGMSDDEIADSLDCRPSTVRSMLSRAMASMRTGAARHSAGSQEHTP
jgi:RNA polymerase sigma-70 factor (sigma-E family)